MKNYPYKLVVRIAQRLKRLGKTEILVLGDSHAKVLKDRTVEALFPSLYFNVVSVGGATLSGLENPNSVSQALPIFNYAFQRSNSNICVVLMGEVDTGFVIWHQAKKYGQSIDQTLSKTVQKYQAFLEKLAQSKHIICISSPLPTIVDNQDWGEVANKRREVSASQLERTKLTLRLNSIMHSHCESMGIVYINLDAESVSEDGLVKAVLRHENGLNHHYDPKQYLKILVPKLSEAIKQVSTVERQENRGGRGNGLT